MNCIYLIQSDSLKIPYEIPEGRDYLFLQWKDEFVPMKNSFHFPNSTWAEGRNELLRRAKEMGMYDYYIFLDDDLKLYFSLGTFEKMLDKNRKPRVVPFLQHQWYRNSRGLSESVKYVDHCFMAVRSDFLQPALLYTLEMDKVNWWLTCERMCERFWDAYPQGTIRFNQLVMVNQKHRDYPKNDYPGFPENIVSENTEYVHPFDG